MVGEPNDVSYKNNKHIAGISIHYFPKDVAVSSQFFMSQRCNMIVLAARLMGTLFWPPNRTFNANAKKKWLRRTRQALRSIISY